RDSQVTEGRHSATLDHQLAHQPVVGGQVGPLVRSVHRADDVLPTSFGEEAVVSTRHELRAVCEGHAKGALPCRPRRSYLGADVASISTLALGPDDLVPND